MRNFVRVENGVVVEMMDLDAHHPDAPGIEGLFHPSMDWRPAPAGCAEGWVVMGDTIVPPDHYQLQRAAKYPPMLDFIDAQVKMSSPDPVMQAEGEVKWNNYVNQCFAVKLAIPKV